MIGCTIATCFLLAGYGIYSVITIAAFASMGFLLVLININAACYFYFRNGPMICCWISEDITKREVQLGGPVSQRSAPTTMQGASETQDGMYDA
jgi:hypothetical protein